MMHQIGNNMNFLDNFFGYLFTYYRKGKNEMYGLYSSLFAMTALFGLNFLVLRDVILKGNSTTYSTIEKYTVPTCILFLLYLRYNSRYKMVIKRFQLQANRVRKLVRILSLVYVVLTILSAIFMSYAIRNNIFN